MNSCTALINFGTKIDIFSNIYQRAIKFTVLIDMIRYLFV